MQDIAQWPAGATYVAQGTVAEDATAGTHICTMTVTPGAGNEIQLITGRMLEGNTATAQSAVALIDDGTNIVSVVYQGGADTVAGTSHTFPSFGTNQTAASLNTFGGTPSNGPIISGTMRLILQITTAAVSVTQTFAVVCRTRGGKPSTVLADTVGAPVLTLNTDKLF